MREHVRHHVRAVVVLGAGRPLVVNAHLERVVAKERHVRRLCLRRAVQCLEELLLVQRRRQHRVRMQRAEEAHGAKRLKRGNERIDRLAAAPRAAVAQARELPCAQLAHERVPRLRVAELGKELLCVRESTTQHLEAAQRVLEAPDAPVLITQPKHNLGTVQ